MAHVGIHGDSVCLLHQPKNSILIMKDFLCHGKCGNSLEIIGIELKDLFLTLIFAISSEPILTILILDWDKGWIHHNVEINLDNFHIWSTSEAT